MKRKILSFNVTKDQNCLADKWFGGYHIVLSGNLSDGSNYHFGWHGNKETQAKDLFPFFKLFMSQKDIIY